ncbi:ADAM 17-like protease isoform X2 [Dysidea avara]|uniref:ADAM 17-like protease isoform X2 n=1 Tax=Dysidea avara TaxID=196820 RepID=UPI003323FE13
MKQLPILISFLFVYTSGHLGSLHDHLHNSLRQFTTLHKDELTHQVLYHDQLTGYHLRMVKFTMMGRDFQLHLSPHQKLFASDFVAYHVDRHGNKRLHVVDKNRFYSGHVLGDKRSSVVAHISEVGVFTGMVTTSDEVYHIEPSHKFIKEPHNYHMIAYRLSDVKFDFSNKSIDFVHAPAINEYLKMQQKKHEQNSATDPIHNRRQKRALTGNTCQMYLVADTYYYNNIGNGNVDDSIISMVSLIGMVDHQTYRDTQFELSNGTILSGLGVQVSAVMVHTEFNDNVDRFPYNINDGADIDEVLVRFSTLSSNNTPPEEPQQDRACLAHLFTFRVFSDSLLGLANIATPSELTTGGICSNALDVGTKRMVYNTGVSSFRRDDIILLRVEGQLVVAHEIGHNWGSSHDNPADGCGDQYLMQGFARTGNHPNNFLLSNCSRSMIAKVLNTSKVNCFVDAQSTKCGNFVVEDDEECDAGHGRDDPCCDDNCKLRPEANCSDVNSDCCTNCSVATTDKLCHIVVDTSADCTTNTTCNGMNVTCPQLELLPKGSECLFGECAAVNETSNSTQCVSLCVVNNKEPCQCSRESDACRVCCRASPSDSCVPFQPGLFLSNGVPCQTNGICENGTCVAREQDDLQMLFDFLHNLNHDAAIRAIKENIVGFLVICTLFVWIPLSFLIYYFDERLYREFLKRLKKKDRQKIDEMSNNKKRLRSNILLQS